jgi:hypothetical protein
MEVKKVREKIILILLLLLVLCITQCSTQKQIIKEDDTAILRRRAQEYWSYKIRGEWDKSYLYESPEYRKEVNITTYIGQNSRIPVKWEGFNNLEIWTSGDEGYMKLNLKYRYLISETTKASFERLIEEKWIKSKDGGWYRLSSTL